MFVFLLQVECHPYFTQRKLIEYHEDESIATIAYAPFGSPNLPENLISEKIPYILTELRLKELAMKHNKTPAQIVLMYLVQ